MSAETGTRRAAPPTGSGPVGVVGPVLAVLLVALGALLVREALVTGGVVGGSTWLPPAAGALDGTAPGGAAIAVGVVAALLGLWLVVVALRRRTRRTLAVGAMSYLSARDVARLAAGAARDVDGVLDVSAEATRKRVLVRGRATSRDGVEEPVRAAVAHQLSALTTPPAIVVRLRPEDDEGGAR
ncbi:DUF6286 domain-containing protein [Kineococcus rubinsiae]|uniref:DUF6286 domain-containing protein n=1 Tax=Kineococcus rubinsiae TaxID=2609562 RepID=UPI0014312889|nr:DUF6286 domain-containing protein [Kineococcus rubinsiae]NIZ92444.1 hypothetical protein [Kineococcus rubinsiae]